MKEKESYRSPSVEVIGIGHEGIIASSTEVTTNVSNPFSGNVEQEW